MTNYVFGYGSLLERASRTRTNPDAVGAWPAHVTGYQRGWFHQFADNVDGRDWTKSGVRRKSDDEESRQDNQVARAGIRSQQQRSMRCRQTPPRCYGVHIKGQRASHDDFVRHSHRRARTTPSRYKAFWAEIGSVTAGSLRAGRTKPPNLRRTSDLDST